MAELIAILPIVSRSSSLTLEIYQLAALETHSTEDFLKIGKTISDFALIVKQVGTIIKEDDRLPSTEALESLEDILDQSSSVLSEFESILAFRSERDLEEGQNVDPLSTLQQAEPSPVPVARLHYLAAHLNSLKSTLSVMLQTMHTAQSIVWARVRPTVSPHQCATAVANEKLQLEMLVIEQQMSILRALRLYEPSGQDALLLMEHDSSQSLITIERGSPKPAGLFKYQDKFIESLDTQNSGEDQWLPAICAISKSQVGRLLDRWSRLPQIEESLQEAERKTQAQKRETQQPFVESDSEDELGALPRFAGNGARKNTPTPRRPGSIQPLFTETATLPIPARNQKFGPTAPLSPASSFGASPRSSISTLPIPSSPGSTPVSPRSSISALPVEATAAVEAKDKDDDIDLEIPWTLRTRRLYWTHIDGKVHESNTDRPSSEAFSDRQSWTEVLASWVCKEAITEAGFKFTQVQKERQDGRRTKFEPLFCIERPLTFAQVHRLVERTVEIYRKNKPVPPPPQEGARRPSFEHHPDPLRRLSSSSHDGGRTPLANSHPPLNRSITTYPPPQPPPLGRTQSMPGAQSTYSPNPRPTNLHPPMPATSVPSSSPYTPQAAPYPPMPVPMPQASAFTSQSPFNSLPQNSRPQPSALFGPHGPHIPIDPHFAQPGVYPPSPLRSSYTGSRHDYYSSASGTSDSDCAAHLRKHSSSSRKRSESRPKKKEHSGTTKALMGVAGLTALLDGLVGI